MNIAHVAVGEVFGLLTLVMLTMTFLSVGTAHEGEGGDFWWGMGTMSAFIAILFATLAAVTWLVEHIEVKA